MRSRNEEPGPAVILTLIQSLSTRVPPVTAERSPPASRITGADSPVMADSSTEAMPCTTSPSPGTRSPASTSTRSPALSCSAEITVYLSESMANSCLAGAWLRVSRSASAWALPRPSATASAKLANQTVSHSQNTSWPENKASCSCHTSRRKRMVATIATASTASMTGLCHRIVGSSFLKAAKPASIRILASNIDGVREFLDMVRYLLSSLFSRSLLVMVVLGTTIHEFVCHSAIAPGETRGWSDQVRP